MISKLYFFFTLGIKASRRISNRGSSAGFDLALASGDVSEVSVFSKPRVNEWSHKRVNPSKLTWIGFSCTKHFGCGTEGREKKS